ncbi:MAG: nucleotidyltransferase family protein [Bacteroidales bacterium]|nr:nucleotidyltransferase family protein [Bacteroidales bacterium]
MKAMIFAAGLGTRLKPLTDRIPKALVPVGGRTLLDLTIDRLVAAGATEIVVNVHHFGEQIIAHLQNHSYPVPIRVSDERQALLDTGGGLRQAFPLFGNTDAPVLIHNVDILHNADLRAFYAASTGAAVTLMVSERQTTRYLLFDDNNRLMGWTNVQTGEVRTPHADLDLSRLRRYAFSGIHCFSPAAYPLMQAYPDKFPIMDFYLRECDKLLIKAYPVEGLRLLDVGKIDSLSAAEDFLQK